MNVADRSEIIICGTSESECGYCKGAATGSKASYGFVSTRMYVDDYERLMLMGWRRSGDYFYHPDNMTTCCPQYTIRLKVSQFVPSKNQRQVLRKFQRYLDTGDFHETPKGPISPKAFSLVTEPASHSTEKFELYKRYQVAVHGDNPEEVTPQSFQRFLVTSPLTIRRNTHNNNQSTHSHALGTFHQLYRLDGQLVAVGVVDILASGLSSVYFFYDPNHRDLSLGKLSALKEIEYASKHGFEYYYMGFYIHNCEKMKYKAEYKPSQLLCSTTLKWFEIEKCLILLNCVQFTPFDPELAAERFAMAGLALPQHKTTNPNPNPNPNQKLSNPNSPNPNDSNNPNVATSESSTTTNDNNNNNNNNDNNNNNNNNDNNNNNNNNPNPTLSPNLSRFRPRFPPGPTWKSLDLPSYPLLLGRDRLTIRDLSEAGQQTVKRLLVELSNHTGMEMLNRLVPKFNR